MGAKRRSGLGRLAIAAVAGAGAGSLASVTGPDDCRFAVSVDAASVNSACYELCKALTRRGGGAGAGGSGGSLAGVAGVAGFAALQFDSSLASSENILSQCVFEKWVAPQPLSFLSPDVRVAPDGCFHQWTHGYLDSAWGAGPVADVGTALLADVPSPVACQERCQLDQDCRAFSWNALTWSCVLKSGEHVRNAINPAAADGGAGAGGGSGGFSNSYLPPNLSVRGAAGAAKLGQDARSASFSTNFFSALFNGGTGFTFEGTNGGTAEQWRWCNVGAYTRACAEGRSQSSRCLRCPGGPRGLAPACAIHSAVHIAGPKFCAREPSDPCDAPPPSVQPGTAATSLSAPLDAGFSGPAAAFPSAGPQPAPAVTWPPLPWPSPSAFSAPSTLFADSLHAYQVPEGLAERAEALAFLTPLHPAEERRLGENNAAAEAAGEVGGEDEGEVAGDAHDEVSGEADSEDGVRRYKSETAGSVAGSTAASAANPAAGTAAAATLVKRPESVLDLVDSLEHDGTVDFLTALAETFTGLIYPSIEEHASGALVGMTLHAQREGAATRPSGDLKKRKRHGGKKGRRKDPLLPGVPTPDKYIRDSGAGGGAAADAGSSAGAAGASAAGASASVDTSASAKTGDDRISDGEKTGDSTAGSGSGEHNKGAAGGDGGGFSGVSGGNSNTAASAGASGHMDAAATAGGSGGAAAGATATADAAGAAATSEMSAPPQPAADSGAEQRSRSGREKETGGGGSSCKGGGGARAADEPAAKAAPPTLRAAPSRPLGELGVFAAVEAPPPPPAATTPTPANAVGPESSSSGVGGPRTGPASLVGPAAGPGDSGRRDGLGGIGGGRGGFVGPHLGASSPGPKAPNAPRDGGGSGAAPTDSGAPPDAANAGSPPDAGGDGGNNAARPGGATGAGGPTLGAPGPPDVTDAPGGFEGPGSMGGGRGGGGGGFTDPQPSSPGNSPGALAAPAPGSGSGGAGGAGAGGPGGAGGAGGAQHTAGSINSATSGSGPRNRLGPQGAGGSSAAPPPGAGGPSTAGGPAGAGGAGSGAGAGHGAGSGFGQAAGTGAGRAAGAGNGAGTGAGSGGRFAAAQVLVDANLMQELRLSEFSADAAAQGSSVANALVSALQEQARRSALGDGAALAAAAAGGDDLD